MLATASKRTPHPIPLPSGLCLVCGSQIQWAFSAMNFGFRRGVSDEHTLPRSVRSEQRSLNQKDMPPGGLRRIWLLALLLLGHRSLRICSLVAPRQKPNAVQQMPTEFVNSTLACRWRYGAGRGVRVIRSHVQQVLVRFLWQSFDGQSVDPDREWIVSPGIEPNPETTDMAEVGLSRILALPAIDCPEGHLHRHPRPPRLAEREVAEKVPSFGGLDLRG